MPDGTHVSTIKCPPDPIPEREWVIPEGCPFRIGGSPRYQWLSIMDASGLTMEIARVRRSIHDHGYYVKWKVQGPGLGDIRLINERLIGAEDLAMALAQEYAGDERPDSGAAWRFSQMNPEVFNDSIVNYLVHQLFAS